MPAGHTHHMVETAPSTPVCPGRWPRAVAALGYGGALAFSVLLLHAMIAAFTWFKFHRDYAMYENMLWNTAHGEWFRYFTELNYLKVHLSFSLALLAPLCRLFDHPFFLAGVQWVSLASGAGLLAWTARRQGLPHAYGAAVVFFVVAYRFTQNVQVHAFHGVSLYFLLIPLLYHTLCFRKAWAAVPWLIILGLREDAAFAVLPLLLYVAVRDRWRGGYLLAGLSIAYGLTALFLLFPWINGASVVETRSREFSAMSGESLSFLKWILSRREGLYFVALPLLPLLGRQLVIAPIFLATALLQSLLSGWRNQYVLETHYSAAVMSLLAVAALEIGVRRLRDAAATGRPARDLPWRAFGLIVITLFVHFRHGVIRGAPRPDHRLLTVSAKGLTTLRAAHQVPREGILLCTGDSEEFFSHRRDLLLFRKADHGREDYHFIFGTMDESTAFSRGRLRQRLDAGEFGIRFFDGYNVLLERGADPARNGELYRTP